MAKHEFVGKTHTASVWDETGEHLITAIGDPVVAQVKGAPKGSLAQVCDICGKTAQADGTMDSGHHSPGHEQRERLAGR